MTLRIVFIRAKLGMMIQMPPRKLTCRDSAWNRIQQREDPLGCGTPAVKNRVMHDLMQKYREVENRESLNQRQRYPDQGIFESDQSPRRESQHRELSSRDDEVAPRTL